MNTALLNNASLSRKGIYQAFDVHGDVIADERWRVQPMLDGDIRIDMDVARIAPFREPRMETISLQLSSSLDVQQLSIHGLAGRRESRVEVSAGRANVCWRLRDISQTREFAWAEDCEIGYNSALFTMVSLWRSWDIEYSMAERRVLKLDEVSFAPFWTRLQFVNLGSELHETRFGPMKLAHYRLNEGQEDGRFSHFWCDETGVVFELNACDGSAYQLVAVNFKG